MPVGSKFKFDIPAKLAYGENSDICVPKSFLKTAQGQSIPKEAFTGKKCTAQTKDGEEDGEFLVNPRAHPMSGKDLIFEVELFAIK
jgi:FKBP-type peptidyl-prolyl cis-trans isomerase 2